MTRYPLFSRNCHESQSLTLLNRDPHTSFCRFDLGKATNSFKYASWILNSTRECKYNTVHFTLWHFQVASGTVKHFQTLSSTNPIDRSSRWFLTCESSAWERKSSCKELHLYHKPGLGVLASGRRTYSRNDHLKKLLETTLTTKMATTLDHVTGARLSSTNK